MLKRLSPAYIVFNNYEIILKWNRSLRFSLAVCTLKKSLKMNYRILSIIFFTFFLIGCEQNSFNKNLANQNKLSKYKNSGFAFSL